MTRGPTLPPYTWHPPHHQGLEDTPSPTPGTPTHGCCYLHTHTGSLRMDRPLPTHDMGASGSTASRPAALTEVPQRDREPRGGSGDRIP